jgi:hippurate hydrolase
VCRLSGGFAANAIPDTALVEGTFRCLSPGEGPHLERELFAEAQAAAKALGARVNATWHRGYRFPVINEKSAVDELVSASEHFSLAKAPTMASEDFAHMLQKVPGAMAWLGLGKKQPGLHASCFDFPDEALAPGIQLVTRLMLGHGKS